MTCETPQIVLNLTQVLSERQTEEAGLEEYVGDAHFNHFLADYSADVFRAVKLTRENGRLSF
jgi:hypothetical protein